MRGGERGRGGARPEKAPLHRPRPPSCPPAPTPVTLAQARVKAPLGGVGNAWGRLEKMGNARARSRGDGGSPSDRPPPSFPPRSLVPSPLPMGHLMQHASFDPIRGPAAALKLQPGLDSRAPPTREAFCLFREGNQGESARPGCRVSRAATPIVTHFLIPPVHAVPCHALKRPVCGCTCAHMSQVSAVGGASGRFGIALTLPDHVLYAMRPVYAVATHARPLQPAQRGTG